MDYLKWERLGRQNLIQKIKYKLGKRWAKGGKGADSSINSNIGI